MGIWNVWFCGSALRGGSLDGVFANFERAVGIPLRLRDKLAPSRPSSPGENKLGVAAPPFGSGVIGEYGRGVEAEKEETWRRMTNSCVAFVSVTIFVRSVDERGCAVPWVLRALDN